MSRTRSVLGLIGWIALSQSAGVVGGFFTASSVGTWYAGLERPAFSPPNWVFGPVWTVLYTLMGIAAWLVWKNAAGRPIARAGLWIFGIQLVLNALWSVIFFGMRDPMWAWVELIALWIAILVTTDHFIRIVRTAGLLMLPYLAWVTFAGVLNYYIWKLNA